MFFVKLMGLCTFGGAVKFQYVAPVRFCFLQANLYEGAPYAFAPYGLLYHHGFKAGDKLERVVVRTKNDVRVSNNLPVKTRHPRPVKGRGEQRFVKRSHLVAIKIFLLVQLLEESKYPLKICGPRLPNLNVVG